MLLRRCKKKNDKKKEGITVAKTVYNLGKANANSRLFLENFFYANVVSVGKIISLLSVNLYLSAIIFKKKSVLNKLSISNIL